MGEWNGNDHYLPMFISWKLDGKNTVDSGLFTGKGKILDTTMHTCMNRKM